MTGLKSLAEKRNKDKLINERKEYLKSEANASLIAVWEDKTNKRIIQNQIKKYEKDFQAQECFLLQVRQRRMKDLYADEESKWRERITNLSQVSTEERMNEIRKRAEALKSKREEEERDFCERMLERQRINGSEELRRNQPMILDSISVPIHNNTKVESCTVPHQYEWVDNEKEDTKKANMTMKLALDEQVRMNDKRRSIINEQKKLDDKIQVDKWNRELMEEKKRLSVERQDKRTKINNEFQTAITEMQREKNREIAERRQQDELLQNISLQSKEGGASQISRESCVSYIESLEYQISSKNKVDPEVEAIREAVQDKLWKEKSQEFRDREERKKKITLEVAMENRARMHENAISKEKDKKQTADFLQNELARMKERSITEEAEKNRKKKEAIENAKYNQAEVERKIKLRVVEKERQVAEERKASNRWQIV